MSNNVVMLPRALTPAQRKLVEDLDLHASVWELAGHYANRVKDRIKAEEFFQAGMEAASRAARRFNPEAGASFKTYAWTDVRGGMCALIREATRAERTVDRGADKFLTEVPDDSTPEDTQADHVARLHDFSNGLVDHMFGAVAGDATKSAAAGAELMAAEHTTSALVREGLDRLPGPQRTLIDLVYFQDGILKDAVGQPGFPNYIKVRREYGAAVSTLRVFLREHGVHSAT